MRTWRVGTISMGILLILLGVYLLLSIFSGTDFIVKYGILTWWPTILIILGIEVLLYLYFMRKESSVVKYDLLSVFLIGVIGLLGIGFFVANEVGIMPKVRALVNQESFVYDLPIFQEKINSDVEQISLQVVGAEITIESQSTDEVSVFGTYVARGLPKEQPINTVEDYLSIQEIGQTLYVIAKPNYENTHSRKTTIVIPDNLEVAIDANYDSLTINPRNITSDWFIKNVHEVDIVTEKDADVKITAQNVQVLEREADWTIDEVTQENNGDKKVGHLQIGDGKQEININNAYRIHVLTK